MALFISRNFADMKAINRYFLFIIVNMAFLMASAQGRLMTIDEVDSIVAQCNLQLEVSRLEMDAAEGQLAQARKRENPEVQLMHNLQNPMNRRWFDMGYDGQTDVQLIPISELATIRTITGPLIVYRENQVRCD